TWYIDVDKICSQKENCIKNSDGSYDIKITLEFWLQRWFYTGVIISSLALFSCLFALAYLQIKTDHNEGTIQ
ncbi:hypothetical protein KKF05_03305, partial [Patescibacteria group bacterium]|nr:hypothetical protein [Patescibacteria group bacterium]